MTLSRTSKRRIQKVATDLTCNDTNEHFQWYRIVLDIAILLPREHRGVFRCVSLLWLELTVCSRGLLFCQRSLFVGLSPTKMFLVVVHHNAL